MEEGVPGHAIAGWWKLEDESLGILGQGEENMRSRCHARLSEDENMKNFRPQAHRDRRQAPGVK